MSNIRKLISLLLTVLFILSLSPVPAFAAAGTGILTVTSSPCGADVYINDVLQSVTTPCSIPLSEGSYNVKIKIKGYKTYIKDKLAIKKGKTVKINQTLLPSLVKVDALHTITVNSGGDSSPAPDISTSDLTGTITLRDAVEAIKNDSSGKHYRIQFASDVNSVTLNSPILLDRRGNLTINGDRDRNGTADITMKYSSSYQDYRGAIDVYSSDTYIIGLNFDGSSIGNGGTLVIRVPDKHQKGEKYDVNNLYILGNSFKNSFEIGVATCGSYGNAATSYGGDGTTNFKNLVYAGNTFDNTALFSFAGAGDEDYNVIDGYYVIANTFYDTGIGMMASDAHTRYVFGEDTTDGNGGTPGNIKYCEHNILRNVLVSGNAINLTRDIGPEYQGIIFVSTADLGNSSSQVYNVEIRNNKSTVTDHYKYACVSIMNVGLGENGKGGKYNIADLNENISDNSIHDINIHNNDFELGQGRDFQIINVFTDEGGQNGDNNLMYNITVNDNKITAPRGVTIANYYGQNKSGLCKNNKMYNIRFYNNDLNAGDASKEVGITAVASAQTAWDSDKMTAYTGSMSDISIYHNTIQNYRRGIVIAGCLGNAADGYRIAHVEVKKNTITCADPDPVGLSDFGITVAGSAYGQPKHGNINCSVSDIKLLDNKITAAGGIAVAGTAVDIDVYGAFTGNMADNITIRGNSIAKSPNSWLKRPLPPILITGIFSYWDGKIAAGTAFDGNSVSNVELGKNKYVGFSDMGILNLSLIPNRYPNGSKSDSTSILESLKKATEKAYGKYSYNWSWQGNSFDSKKAGTYLAIGKSRNYTTGIDVLFYEVTVLP